MTKEAKMALEKLIYKYKTPPNYFPVADRLTYDETKRAWEDISERQAAWEAEVNALAEEFCRAYKGEPF